MNVAPRPSHRRELVFGLAFMGIATVVTLALGEIAVRVVASHHLIYNIEMVKYAVHLKMPDPSGEVSHVHRPSAHEAISRRKPVWRRLAEAPRWVRWSTYYAFGVVFAVLLLLSPLHGPQPFVYFQF